MRTSDRDLGLQVWKVTITVITSHNQRSQMLSTHAQMDVPARWISPRHWLPLYSWWWGTQEIDCTAKVNRELPCWLSWTDDAPRLELFTQFERNNPFARPYLIVSLFDVKSITVRHHFRSQLFFGTQVEQMPGKRSTECFLHLHVGSRAQVYPADQHDWFKPCLWNTPFT